MKNTLTPCASATPASVTARLAGIALARRTVLQDHAALPAGWLAPSIERSWQRCIRLGMQPQQSVGFAVLSAQQMRHTAQGNRHLVDAARPVVEQLGRAIADTHYFAILTNADGIVVDVSGAIDRSDRRADSITRIGADLSERSVGTTAISLALAERQSVWLHRGEHFFTDTAHYSCAGAPLFGADGACVGMLDLTGIDAIERPELKHLVTQSAGKIGNALVLREPHQLLLRLNWPGNALGGDTDGLVGLDRDGWITAANQNARQMVPNLAPPGQPAVHASEVFGAPYQLLFDAAQRTPATLEIPLWSGLRLLALPIGRAHELRPIEPGQRLRCSDNMPLKDVQTALIRKAVQHARGNVAQAARALGISRATVYRKLGEPR